MNHIFGNIMLTLCEFKIARILLPSSIIFQGIQCVEIELQKFERISWENPSEPEVAAKHKIEKGMRAVSEASKRKLGLTFT